MAHPFEKRRLRQISAYNVSTVRDIENSSIMTNKRLTTGFPTSYRWSGYVTPKSPKGWLKTILLVFVNKIQLQSNEFCYKVSLCENFQRQSYSITIPPCNVHRYRRKTQPFNLNFSLKVNHPPKIVELARTLWLCHS